MNKEELLNKCKKYNGEKLKDYHYYLLSECSDIVDFNAYWSEIKINNLHIDINKNGIIHIWSNCEDGFICYLTNCSSCELLTGVDYE